MFDPTNKEILTQSGYACNWATEEGEDSTTYLLYHFGERLAEVEVSKCGNRIDFVACQPACNKYLGWDEGEDALRSLLFSKG